VSGAVDRFVHREYIRVGAWCPKHDAAHLIVSQVFIVTMRGVWRSWPKTECG